MSAQPAEPGPHELIRPDDQVIHVGDQAAVIVSLDELRRLRALERHASPEAILEAEIEADNAAHLAWVAAGRPGATSHADFMSELLAPSGGWPGPSRA